MPLPPSFLTVPLIATCNGGDLDQPCGLSTGVIVAIVVGSLGAGSFRHTVARAPRLSLGMPVATSIDMSISKPIAITTSVAVSTGAPTGTSVGMSVDGSGFRVAMYPMLLCGVIL